MTHADRDWTERGRRLASQRDDLIASGVDPSLLEIPSGPSEPRELNRFTSPQEATGATPAPQATGEAYIHAPTAHIESRQVCAKCNQDWGAFHKGCDGEWVTEFRIVTPWHRSAEAAHAPAGLPLHEPTDRDASDVPSDEDRAHDVIVDDYGEHVCAACGYTGFTPPSLPCPGHRDPETVIITRAVADREQAALRADNAQWEESYLRLDESHKAQMDRAENAEAEVERLRRDVLAVVVRMTNRKIDHRHEDQVGHWGVKGRAYFYAGDIYDDWQDLRAALRISEPTEDA